MKIKLLITGIILAITMGIQTAQATPLRLDYTVTDNGNNQYAYQFQLILDNNDNSWVSGQGWGVIRFGNGVRGESGPRLTNFVGDDSALPVGPFTTYIDPTGLFGPGLDGADPNDNSKAAIWVPTAVGQSLYWSGTSNVNLAQGQLNFRAARTVGMPGSSGVATLVDSIQVIPEPGTMVLAGMGLLLLGAKTRRS